MKKEEREKMKTKVSRLVVCVAVVALVFSAFALPAIAAEKAKKAPASVTITGSVAELMKGEKGKPVIGIKTDKGDYMLTGKKSAELTKLVGKKVEATGAVHEKKGKHYINVTSYKVMEGEPAAK
jgi:hypothetical protein